MANHSKYKWNLNRPQAISSQKFTYDEWKNNNCHRIKCCETQRFLNNQIAAKIEKDCSLTSEKVKNNKEETDYHLNQRIKDIEYFKEELVKNRVELASEVDSLSLYKERLTNSLKSLKENALDICEKNLTARDHRLGIDLVIDDAEKMLRKECHLIKCSEKTLNQILKQTTSQLQRLKSILYFMDHDLQDKENNLRIDRYNSTLKETSLNLSIYQGESSLNMSNVTIEEWERHIKKTLTSSNKEIQISKALRNQIDSTLKQVFHDLISQKDATNSALKKRIEETKNVKEKLEIEHSNIMKQAKEMTRNITRLEKIIAEKEGFIALAHTRLGNRCQRNGLELTRDLVELSLTKEVSDLRDIVAQLQQTLFDAQASLRFLLKMQIQLEEDINIKTNTLKIDEVDCLTLRQSIEYHVF